MMALGRMATLTLVLLALLAAAQNVLALPCAARNVGEDKIICVCNATYCDTLERPQGSLDPGTAQVFQSSRQGDRFASSILHFQPPQRENNFVTNEDVLQVRVNSSQEFQEIIGFGGAFTDAAGINMDSLPKSMKNHIVHAYYSINGSEYNIGRVPMGSCDFSTRAYSYDDVPGDMNLEHFQLAQEDLQYKIPFILEGASVSTQPLLLFGSPWAPPAWMKSNGKMNGAGQLKGDVGGEYYQTWANYFVKFLQAYEHYNLTFWGLTTQNEPLDGFIEGFSFQCLGFNPETQTSFVALNLGPALKAAGYGVDKIKLMIMDDQRVLLPAWPNKVFSNANASSYVSGIAFHWYMNVLAPPRILDITHQLFPDMFLISTEACEGSQPWQPKVILGDWGRAESYAHDVIEDLLHWTSAWVDWNLALNTEGGPNWVSNFVDAPIIVNASGGEFYKQPMYYALAHFSKFIKSGSKRILTETSSDNSKTEVAAFKTPNGTIVLVAVNRRSTEVTLDIQDVTSHNTLQHTLPAHSIQTYLWTGTTPAR